MPTPTSATEALDGEFLTIRAKLIEIAAALDRIDRAKGSVADDPRAKQIHRSLEVLCAPGPNRAEQIQMNFSLPYDQNWQTDFTAKE